MASRRPGRLVSQPVQQNQREAPIWAISTTFNAGIALGLMAELATERLAQLETADGDQEGTAET